MVRFLTILLPKLTLLFHNFVFGSCFKSYRCYFKHRIAEPAYFEWIRTEYLKTVSVLTISAILYFLVCDENRYHVTSLMKESKGRSCNSTRY